MDIDAISGDVVDSAVRIHKKLGPGLLESVYETVLAADLERRGHKVDRQKAVDIEFEGLFFPAAFRIDILVDETLVLEIKSVESFTRAHAKQLLTYLRLTGQPVGLLLNFSFEAMREGIKRLVNDYLPPQ